MLNQYLTDKFSVRLSGTRSPPASKPVPLVKIFRAGAGVGARLDFFSVAKASEERSKLRNIKKLARGGIFDGDAFVVDYINAKWAYASMNIEYVAIGPNGVVFPESRVWPSATVYLFGACDLRAGGKAAFLVKIDSGGSLFCAELNPSGRVQTFWGSLVSGVADSLSPPGSGTICVVNTTRDGAFLTKYDAESLAAVSVLHYPRTIRRADTPGAGIRLVAAAPLSGGRTLAVDYYSYALYAGEDLSEGEIIARTDFENIFCCFCAETVAGNLILYTNGEVLLIAPDGGSRSLLEANVFTQRCVGCYAFQGAGDDGAIVEIVCFESFTQKEFLTVVI